MIDAAQRHRGSSYVLGLTARADAPLVEVVDATVPLGAAHVEQSGIATLTLSRHRRGAGGARRPAGPATSCGTGSRRRSRPCRRCSTGASGGSGGRRTRSIAGRPIHVLADGARLGAAEQAALMLREAPRIPATAYETGDWLHVGLYTLAARGSRAAVRGIARRRRGRRDGPTARRRRRLGRAAMARRATSTSRCPATALMDPLVRSLVEPAVAELLAQELWRRTTAAELEA